LDVKCQVCASRRTCARGPADLVLPLRALPRHSSMRTCAHTSALSNLACQFGPGPRAGAQGPSQRSFDLTHHRPASPLCGDSGSEQLQARHCNASDRQVPAVLLVKRAQPSQERQHTKGRATPGAHGGRAAAGQRGGLLSHWQHLQQQQQCGGRSPRRLPLHSELGQRRGCCC
jgi:hypothetical protein